MNKAENPIGVQYNRYTVIKEVPHEKEKNRRFLCRCICGTFRIVAFEDLKNGHSKSCGCLLKELASKRFMVHGYSQDPRMSKLYNAWRDMKYRCNNQNAKHYDRYGGRGISVCNEWQHDFRNFYNWAIANGYKDNLSIDRINNDGDYEPNNCRWATSKEQASNRHQNNQYGYCNKTEVDEACSLSQ